jgi:hypothetical protein
VCICALISYCSIWLLRWWESRKTKHDLSEGKDDRLNTLGLVLQFLVSSLQSTSRQGMQSAVSSSGFFLQISSTLTRQFFQLSVEINRFSRIMQAVEESSCVKSLLLPFLYHLFFHLRKQNGSCLAVDCKGGFSRLCFGIHVEIGKCWKAEKLPSSSGKIWIRNFGLLLPQEIVTLWKAAVVLIQVMRSLADEELSSLEDSAVAYLVVYSST